MSRAVHLSCCQALVLILLVPVSLRAELEPYFTGSVSALIKPGPDIMSAAQATLYTGWGTLDTGTPYSLEHKIIEDVTSVLLDIYTSGAAIGDSHSNLRKPASYPDCYRGRLIVSTLLYGGSWGSPKACAPEEEGVPGGSVQPGDGTGETADPRPRTPIVIDMEGDGFRFTSLLQGTTFDLDVDGVAESSSWTHPQGDEVFLVLDRNGDGRISDGTELFGDSTPQPASPAQNGFAALAVFDRSEQGGNGDGLISSADLVFASLRLWRDSNHDGVSQPAELQLLSWSRIRAIALDYVLSRRRDRHGNQLRWASRVQFDHGWRLAAVDVLFVTN